MKAKLKTRIAAAAAAAVVACSAAAVPAEAKYNRSRTVQGDAFMVAAQTYWKYGEKLKFPAGKYWNSGNPDTWTDTPCTGQTSNWRTWTRCTHVPFKNVINAGYTALSSNETYSYLTQCYGFARKLAQDFYGGCEVWVRHRYSSDFQFRAGDQVRISNDSHSVYITAVNGNSIEFADCNWDNHCGIRWDVSATISNGRFCFGGNSYQISYIDRPAMAGDANGDSKITWADVEAIYRLYRGTYNYGSANPKYVNEAADLDNDGQVTYNDWVIAYVQYDGKGYYRQQRFLTGIDL